MQFFKDGFFSFQKSVFSFQKSVFREKRVFSAVILRSASDEESFKILRLASLAQDDNVGAAAPGSPAEASQ